MGKAKHEDHRWALIRTWFQGRDILWNFFVFFFVNVYQMSANYAFCALPLDLIYYGPDSMIFADLPLAILFCVFLCVESIADDQMFNFQQIKTQRIRKRLFCQYKADQFADGFYQSGLYRFCRHPNYFGELGQWCTIYLFSCLATKGANWSIIGAINLSFIVYKSMNFTESITNFKYPKYKIYARKTSQLILWRQKPPKVQSKKQN